MEEKKINDLLRLELGINVLMNTDDNFSLKDVKRMIYNDFKKLGYETLVVSDTMHSPEHVSIELKVISSDDMKPEFEGTVKSQGVKMPKKKVQRMKKGGKPLPKGKDKPRGGFSMNKGRRLRSGYSKVKPKIGGQR